MVFYVQNTCRTQSLCVSVDLPMLRLLNVCQSFEAAVPLADRHALLIVRNRALSSRTECT